MGQARIAAARFSFKKELEQHQILLVLDLINLFLVTTATELKELAGHFGVTLNNKRLEQLTFVLKKTDLISDLKYGGTLYFYPKKFRKPYIDYTSADKTKPFNRARAIAERASRLLVDDKRKYVYGIAKKNWL